MESMECEASKPIINSLDDLIRELHRIFAEDNVNIDEVKAVLSAYKSDPKEWKKYAKFDPHRYTRNLIDDGNGKFNLMALCWGEGMGSSIHDHSDSHCFVKMLDNQLQETMFVWPQDSEEEQQMTRTAVTVYDKNSVSYMSDEIGLHRMENPSHTERSVSMHLYSPPFKQCKTFDERTGHTNTVSVTFWSQYGQRTPLGGFKPTDRRRPSWI